METARHRYPSSLREAAQTFSDPSISLEVVAAARWGWRGPACPCCKSRKRLSFLKTRMLWKCLDCRKQFSVKAGTIFEGSPIRLNKWLCAAWMLANRNSVSSREMARALKVAQATAWFVLHRLRHAMHTGGIGKTPR